MRVRLLLAFILVLPAHASDTFNPFPQHLQQPADDASFARLTVDAGGKTPTVKKLDPAWAKSLADRGEAETYTKSNSNNFSYLGMPVGGIGAGELYLSGDGRLWEWDIFNTRAGGGDGFPVEQGDAYSGPHIVGATNDPFFQTPIAEGFVLRTKSGTQVDTRTLDKDGFGDVRFRGQYPIGYVDYADPGCPVKVSLEAFSPYDPGSVADSTYPATVLNYTLTNTSSLPVECTLGGWLENGVAPRSRADNSISVLLDAKAENRAAGAMVSETIRAAHPAPPDEAEPIGGIGSGTYADWTVEGTAFGSAPMSVHDYSYDFQIIGMAGGYFINSRRDGKDDATGKLTSKSFTINRPYLRFRLGGGKNPGQECINLLVDGQVVETATGEGYEVLGQHDWDVTKFQGKTAVLQIVDAATGKDGHILISDIEQGDLPSYPQPLEHREDFGTMAFAALNNPSATEIIPCVQGPDYAHALFDAAPAASAEIDPHGDNKLVSALRSKVTLAPGQKVTLSFVVAWDFPNALPLRLRTAMNRQYSVRFKSAADVATHISADFQRLADSTRLWHDTFYDSTLPWWFLDRTFANTSTLATSTSYYLADGRFYGFEGRYSCPGTCTHVWGYQPAVGHLFPGLEKSIMEKVEFVPGLGMNPQGGVSMRGEFDKNPPTDGQAGIILRTYLAHRMSGDDSFLRRNYDAIKQAMDYLITTHDSTHAGLLVGPQPNTMDGTWFGKIPWMSLHYQAALRAMAEMADDKGDHAYAATLRGIADKGRDYVENHLWNGEYFFQEADPDHAAEYGTYDGCPLEQLMGQSWAHAVGLGDIVDPQKVATALDSIWKYNYTTDAGLYRQSYPDGRVYAMPGESALVMCTFPHAPADKKDPGDKNGTGYSGYDRETWTGSEYEITSEMMWAGHVDQALAEVRSINDRYNGAKRNPWDECECGSHYSRAMSSYGVFIAACGYEYNGPKAAMAFAPRVHPEEFQAGFTAAEGWGRYQQKYNALGMDAALTVRHGQLRLKTFSLVIPEGAPAKTIHARIDGETATVSSTRTGNRLSLAFSPALHLTPNQKLQITVE